MEQRLINYLHGYIRIRIRGNFCDRFLNLCAFHGICLWELSSEKDIIEACISKSDFFHLKEIVKKSHTRIQIIKRYGFPFFMHKYRTRWACVGGAVAAWLLMGWLSAHIWNISIEGNHSQTDDVIFEYLENEGVSHGMWKNQIDTKILSEQLRMYFTSFSWVSAELKGTRLIIYVREGIQGAEEMDSGLKDDTGASSLMASKAGTVVSLYVRKGQAAVSAGDTVEKGDLLVSGQIPIYNDEGEAVSVRNADADADILLRTETAYYDEQSYETVIKNYTGHEKTRYLVRIFGFSFSLPGTFRNFEFCDIIGRITQLKLSENYYLPLYFHKYTSQEYEYLQYDRTDQEIRNILETNLSEFMENLKEKGVQIFQNNVTIDLYENTAVAEGILITEESAVIRQAENSVELQKE